MATAEHNEQVGTGIVNELGNDSKTSKNNSDGALSHSVSATSVADFHNHDASAGAAVNESIEEEAVGTNDVCLNVAPKSAFDNGVHTNMCSFGQGAKVLFATDDWFANAEDLLQDGPPLFFDDLYCEQGKVLDGWETRRRREVGHDWCIIKLTDRAAITGIEIDTAHFTGNQVPRLSIDIADLTCTQQTELAHRLPHAIERLLHGGVRGTGATPQEVEQAKEAASTLEWKELLAVTPLQPGFESTRIHSFTLPEPIVGTLIRVNYFPDGGVARLRLWGSAHDSKRPKQRPLYMPITTGDLCTVVSHFDAELATEPAMLPSRQAYEFPELSSKDSGALGVACSNKHYGEPWRLTQTTLGKDMGDGWETARHPSRPSVLVKNLTTGLIDSPLMDWSILKLGQMAHAGVARIILDTRHFKGNYPESVVLEGCSWMGDDSADSITKMAWFPLISRVRMSPHSEHVFERSKGQIGHAEKEVTHVRLSIFPDGGMSRVRIYG